MSSSIQLLNLISSMNGIGSKSSSSYSSLSSLGGLTGSCSCNSGLESTSASNSSAFNIMLTSLLNAISEKNKMAKSESEKVSLEDIFSTYNNSKLNGTGLNIDNYISVDVSNLSVDERIENAVQLYSNKYGVDSNLVKAIIKAESNFNPNVVSSAGAKGLMQLMPENCKALGVIDPFNIEQNIEGGVKHIKEYIDRYNGNIEMALMAYNGGPTRMMNRGVKSIDDIYKMPKETQNYVPKVMSYYRGFENGN